MFSRIGSSRGNYQPTGYGVHDEGGACLARCTSAAYQRDQRTMRLHSARGDGDNVIIAHIEIVFYIGVPQEAKIYDARRGYYCVYPASSWIIDE